MKNYSPFINLLLHVPQILPVSWQFPKNRYVAEQLIECPWIILAVVNAISRLSVYLLLEVLEPPWCNLFLCPYRNRYNICFFFVLETLESVRNTGNKYTVNHILLGVSLNWSTVKREMFAESAINENMN